MPKISKQIVNVLGIVFLSVVGVLVGLLVFPRLFVFAMDYSERFIECDPQQMVPHLERVFDIDFPEEIREVKAATSRSSWLKRNMISFKFKFTADPDTVAMFFQSFPKKIHFGAYDPSSDLRHSDLRRTPQWFKKPIQQGKIGSGGVSGRRKNIRKIYIDTTNEKDFVIYLDGFYHRNL